MVKVFVGNGQILNINHTIANVNFDAEDQFINRNLSNDVIINIDKGDLELWRNREIVKDENLEDEEEVDEHYEIDASGEEEPIKKWIRSWSK